MPHLHLSLQAGDDMILKRMKRRHSRADVIAVCERARRYRPEIGFGADIIAGFPTEDDAMFENSMRIVKECDLTFLHVFPYSEREGTPAAKIPANKQVPLAVRKERAAQLRALGQKQLEKFHKAQIGKHVWVIMEKDGKGRAENFALVECNKKISPGSLIHVKIKEFEGGILNGMIV